MNWIDLILLIIIGWSIYNGFTKGFIISIASLCALILGVYGAIKFSGYTAEILSSKFSLEPDKINLISFIITFVLIVILTHIVTRLADRLVKAVALSLLNRVLGVLFCTLRNLLIVSVVLVIIGRVNENVTVIQDSQIEKSILFKPIQSLAPALYPYLRSGYEKIKEENHSPDGIITEKKINYSNSFQILSLQKSF